jgi:hypothetical protein
MHSTVHNCIFNQMGVEMVIPGVLVSFVLLFSNSFVIAFDENIADRLLQWLPGGNISSELSSENQQFFERVEQDLWQVENEPVQKYHYSNLIFFNRLAFQKNCPVKVHQMLSDNQNTFEGQINSLLPRSFSSKWEVALKAKFIFLGIKAAEGIDENGERVVLNRKCSHRFVMNDFQYCSWYPSRSLYVVTIDNLKGLIAKAVDNGELDLLKNESKNPEKIYSVGSEKKVFICPANARVVLIAQNQGDLQQMLAAHNQKREVWIDEHPVSALVDRHANCYFWRWKQAGAGAQLLLDYLRYADPASESIDELEHDIDHSVECIFDQSNWDQGNHSQQITAYYADIAAANEQRGSAAKLPQDLSVYCRDGYYFSGLSVSFRPVVLKLQSQRSSANLTRLQNRISLNMSENTEEVIKLLLSLGS